MHQKPPSGGPETPPNDANGRSDTETQNMRQTPVKPVFEPLTAYTDDDLRDALYMLNVEGDEADDIILELARRITAARGQS